MGSSNGFDEIVRLRLPIQAAPIDRPSAGFGRIAGDGIGAAQKGEQDICKMCSFLCPDQNWPPDHWGPPMPF